MAYQAAAEHPYKTFVSQLRASQQSGIYPAVILLCGKEKYLVSFLMKKSFVISVEHL